MRAKATHEVVTATHETILQLLEIVRRDSRTTDSGGIDTARHQRYGSVAKAVETLVKALDLVAKLIST
jgi:hypothetical protein